MSATEHPGTISGTGETRTARFERRLAHPPADVWEALTSSDALGRCWRRRPSSRGSAVRRGSTSERARSRVRSPCGIRRTRLRTDGRSPRTAPAMSRGRWRPSMAARRHGSCSSTPGCPRTGQPGTAAAGTPTSSGSRPSSPGRSLRTGRSVSPRSGPLTTRARSAPTRGRGVRGPRHRGRRSALGRALRARCAPRCGGPG
jgi:hypothetical protein